jgi:predicted permease
MGDLLQDLRYGVRKLRFQPAFASAVLIILAVGIGSTTAMFSAVDAALLRPLAFTQDDRLVEIDDITLSVRSGGGEVYGATPGIGDLEALPGVFSSVAAYASGGMNLTGADLALRVRIGLVTPSFFQTWGVQPVIGRPFADEEGQPSGPRVAIFSDRLWRRLFGADPSVVGRSVRLNGNEYRVIGVMSTGFGFPEDTEIWLPLRIPMSLSDWEPFRQVVPTHVLGRLAPGVSVDLARTRVKALFSSFNTSELPWATASMGQVRMLREVLLGSNASTLVVLLGATVLVLLIACASVGNLLLSQAVVRERELALRATLGASPNRLARQLLVESFLLCLAGSVGGVLLAFFSLGAIEVLIPPTLRGVAHLRIDGHVLLFCFGMALLTGTAFGFWPALRARRGDVGAVVRMAGTGAVSSRGYMRTQRVIVVVEVALALMLLVGTGVMLRSLYALLSRDPGIRPDGVASLEISLASADYDAVGRRQFIRAVLDRLTTKPYLTAAAVVNELPLRGESAVRLTVTVDGKPIDGREPTYAQDLRVSPDYFHALGIPLLRGRSFLQDNDTGSVSEVLINETLARRLWPNENPIGEYIRFGALFGRYRVVGVVGDVLPTALDRDGVPQVYSSFLKSPSANFAIVARGRGPGKDVIAWLQSAVRDVDPHQALYNARTMDQVVASTLAPRRTTTLLFSVFAGLALGLASIGVYGIISYGVTRRTREIGIRMALGAPRGRVILNVMREGLVISSIGIGIGLLGAWLLAHVLAGLVYGIAPTDPAAFSIAAVILLGIAVTASLVPALRAAGIDPNIAMKIE